MSSADDLKEPPETAVGSRTRLDNDMVIPTPHVVPDQRRRRRPVRLVAWAAYWGALKSAAGALRRRLRAALPPVPGDPLIEGRPRWVDRYGPGFVALVLATLLKFVLESAGVHEGPVSFYLSSTVVAAWFGGMVAGWGATAVAAVLISQMFNEARIPFGISSMPDARVWMFVVEGVLISVIMQRLHTLRNQRTRMLIEAQRARLEAQAQAEHLRLTQLAVHAGSWDWQLQTDTLTWSEELSRSLGRSQTAPGAGRAAWLAAIHPDDRTRAAEALARSRERRERFEIEYRIVRPDGEVRQMVTLGRTLVDADGRPERVLGMTIDITERSQVAEALRESEQRLRLIFDATHDVIWDWDLRTQQITWNERAVQVLDSSGQILDTSPATREERIHPDDRPRVAETLARSINGHAETWTQEYRLRRADGTYGTFIDRAYIARDRRGIAVRVIGCLLDLGPHIQAEERLRELSVELAARLRDFEALMEAIPAAVWVAEDPAAMKVVGNRYACGLLNVPYGTNVSQSHPDRVVALPHVVNGRAAQSADDLPMQRCVRTGQAVLDIELEVIGADGEARVLLGNAVPLYNNQGGVRGCVSAFVDVTQRQQVERALRESETRFRELSDAMPQIVWSAHPNGVLDYVNQRGRVYLGASAEAPSAVDWIRGLHAEERVQIVERWRTALESGTEFQAECRLLDARSGTHRWHLIRAVPARHTGDIVRWYGTCTDIDDQKRAAATLNLALRSSNAVVSEWRVEDDSLTWSEDVEQLYGTAVMPTLHAWLERVAPEDRDRVRNLLRATCERRQEHLTFEFRIVRPDGTVRWLVSRRRLTFGEAGELVGMISLSFDITERRQAQEALEQTREALLEYQRSEKQRIRAELETAREQLVRQTRLATVGQLAASVAHDLRNPLSVIMNAAFLLRRRVKPIAPESADLVQMIEEEVGTADRIIANLMGLTRTADPERGPVDLGRFVDELLTKLPRPAGVSFEVRLAERPFIIWADADQLRRILTNLLMNALDAVQGAGAIAFDARHVEGFDELDISDTGPGVAPEVRGRLFEPLVTSKTKGTGLGLLTCAQLVQSHGGTIELVDSAGGATFRVRLPRQSKESA